MVQEYEMNEGNHININNIKIKAKINELNKILTECVSKKYIASNKECTLFLMKYEKLYVYVDKYVNKLKSRILSHQQTEGINYRNNRIMISKENVNVLVETHNDFIRDYLELFTYKNNRNKFSGRNDSVSRGCILIKLENISFVKWFYGDNKTNLIVDLMEKQMMAASNNYSILNRCKYKIRIYHGIKDDEYIILVSPTITFQEFKCFCLHLGKIRFNVPKSWKPISFSPQNKLFCEQNHDFMDINDEFYGISPSKEIEGISGRNRNKNHGNKKRKGRKKYDIQKSKSFASFFRRNKSKSKVKDNDDAASIVSMNDYGENNDENMDNNNINIKYKEYMKQCKELKEVFVTVCGAFSDKIDCEYYEKCELLQRKLCNKLRPKDKDESRPLQVSNQIFMIDQF